MSDESPEPARSPRFVTLGFAALLCVTLGLAPFGDEPHIVGKLRWVAGGGHGMQPLDVFDLVLHGAPWIFLAVEAIRVGVQIARGRG